MLDTIGDVSFGFAGAGILLFTVLYLLTVRWWTDVLGWAIAGAMTLTSLIVLIAISRMLGFPPPGGTQLWRAVIYPVFGLFVWVVSGVFIWAQFVAPRARRKRESQQ